MAAWIAVGTLPPPVDDPVGSSAGAAAVLLGVVERVVGEGVVSGSRGRARAKAVGEIGRASADIFGGIFSCFCRALGGLVWVVWMV